MSITRSNELAEKLMQAMGFPEELRTETKSIRISMEAGRPVEINVVHYVTEKTATDLVTVLSKFNVVPDDENDSGGEHF